MPTRSQFWRRFAAVARLAIGVAAVATSMAQSPAGKWWPGYGNGADNSRYFASRQINKSNVSRLQVGVCLINVDFEIATEIQSLTSSHLS